MKRQHLLLASAAGLGGLCIMACDDAPPSDGGISTGGGMMVPATGGSTGTSPGTAATSTAGVSATGSGTAGRATVAPPTGGSGGDVTGGSPAAGGDGGAPGGGGSSAIAGSGSGGSAGSGTGGSPPDPDVLTVQLGEVRQVIRGFGLSATITDGNDLPWEQLYTLEGENALGLSILRIGMHESGGHRNVPAGWETVKSLGARVIGTCWSAPAAWKTNSSSTAGGHLLPEYYEQWATRIAQYASDNDLYAMSIGNQTDFASCAQSAGTCTPPLGNEFDTMVYTGREMAVFVSVAGPIFEAIAPNTQMIAPEASSWIHVWSNLSPDGRGQVQGDGPEEGYLSSDPLDCACFANEIDPAVAATCAPHCINGAGGELADAGYDYGHWLASDPDAWSAFDILGVHQYEAPVGVAWPADVTDGVRDREVWQTEVAGERYWPEQGPSTSIENGVAVARWIHSALTVGEASAWLYWQYKSHFENVNDGLGLLLNNSINDTPTAKRYFTMGNFSRYIRPDVFHAVRVAGPAPENIMVSAYKGDNGEVVIVAINETSEATNVPIALTGGTAPVAFVPIVTSGSENWGEGDPVAVVDGSLPASLPAMSVTTFVGQ